MGYDATGKLVYGPNNLFLQSQTFDNASWVGSNRTVTANTTVAPDGTTTADTLAGTGAGGALLRQDVAVSGVNSVVASFYVKANTATTCTISDVNFGGLGVFNLSTGAVISGSGASISSAGNGWYRCAIAYAPSAGFARVAVNPGSSFNLNTTTSIYLWGAQLEAVTYQTTPSTYYPTTTAAYYGPRLVYDPVTLASQGILPEEARTNSCTQSQDLSTTWTLGGSTVTANNTTSPDGTVNADKLVEDSSAAAEHRCFNTFTGVSGTTYTYSVYAKADTRGGINIRMQATGTPIDIYYDVSTGAVTSTTAGTGSIQSVGNGWYRCIATGASDLSGSVRITINLLQTAGGTTRIYSGDGTSGLFLWQAQVEAGTGASSPIPTTTAAVTRAADVPVLTGLSVASESTVVFEWTRYPFSAATFPRLFDITDGSANNRKSAYGSGGNVWSTATVGGASQGDVLAGSGQTADTAYKMATRWAVGSRRSAINGTLGTLGTADIASAVLTQLNTGCSLGGTAQLNGTISRIRIYNTALTDTQLQAITQSLLLQEDDFSILQEDNSYIWLE
jgi:hypothetical protein